MGQARNELENIGVESGRARQRFESANESLKRLEAEIASLRESLQARRAEENALRARANQLRSEHATVAGRHFVNISRLFRKSLSYAKNLVLSCNCNFHPNPSSAAFNKLIARIRFFVQFVAKAIQFR